MIEQSGSVTPGHIARWMTTGVISDGGVMPPTSVIARLLSANFNSTADQPIQFDAAITAFRITNIIITNASLSLTLAAGGFYPTVSKGGTALVSAAQVYSSLTTANVLLAATLAAAVATTRYSAANVDRINGFLTLYLALTTAQPVAATADVYIIGNNLSV